MDIDDEEDKNEPELTFPYEETNPLNPPPPAFDLEPEDVIEVEDTVEPEDEIAPAMGCPIEEMIRRGVVFEERPSKAIDVPVEDEESPSSELRGSPYVANQMGWTEMKKLMTMEFCLAEELQRMENELWNLKVTEYNMVAYTQIFNELALMCPRMVEPKSVKINGYIRGLSNNIKGMKGFLKEISGNRRTFKVGTLVVRETTRITHASGTEGAVELRRWFEKTEMTFGISECAEDKKVKFDAATLRGPALTWWNYKVAILGLDVTNPE
ncbi:reverse transcriptase domain-containing protein [Tanacetum coccineum]